MNKVKVTIVTPSFNQGQYIEETILSVLSQTYDNVEYIVFDACSTDKTPDILKKYADKITAITEKDKGQTDAINKGFKMAKGEIVGWINSDDILYPDCVQRIVDAYLADPNESIFYNSNCNIIDGNGKMLYTLDRKIASKEYLLHVGYKVLQPGSFYAADKVKAVDYLDIDLNYSMDLDLWLKLLTLGGIVNIGGKAIAAYREWELTKTNTGAEKFYKNIYDTLYKYGASWHSRSIIEVRYLYLKCLIKSKLKF